MSRFDFIREAYEGTGAMLLACGTWLVQNWLIVFILLALTCIGIGLAHEIKHAPLEEEPPLDACAMVELAQEWLTLCRSESTTRPEHDESY